jgi:hypothetical protein
MIAVNASISPYSSVSFTPFGRDALTLADKGKGEALAGSGPRTARLLRGRTPSAALSI